MRPVHALAGVACLALAAAAWAQSTPVAAPDNAPVQTAPLVEKPATWGDAQAGQAKAGACAACHGLDGNAMQQNAPRIAGMPERYLAEQLHLFKSGQRTGGLAAIMAPFAGILSAQDMRDVGAWYATQKAGTGVADDTAIAEGPNQGLKFYQVGERLFRSGDPARGLPACMACHGPSGAGNPGPAYPALHGQDSAYVTRRLEEYRTGTTTYTAPAHFKLMAAVSKSLSDEEIRSLASYVQGLHTRAPGTTKESIAR
ncbi:cytochrome c4 [Thermomonas fusca]|uniref:Cytochrome c4 n=2 Tax=Thermomonas fusca TaxID=215690 RepID=A0A5R9PD40_9GAMM|nr:c-type cytochrome [Thermomonas fusca]TLX21136.1 cytochrome c4 [Thermomonas fusca]